MKKLLFIFVAVVAMAAVSCKNGKTEKNDTPADSVITTEGDTTLYGVCSDGTTMNYLELVTEHNDTMGYVVYSDSVYSPVKGGMNPGDRMAVIGHKEAEEMVADRVINITTLMGRWTSIDKNFELQEGGAIKSVVSETNNYTRWEIFNGRLVLAPDTFDIYSLGSDSLMLENANGIFVYGRLK